MVIETWCGRCGGNARIPWLLVFTRRCPDCLGTGWVHVDGMGDDLPDSESAGRPVPPHRSGGGLPPEEPEGPSHVPYYLRHSEDDLPVSGEEFLRRYPQLASTKTTDSEPAEGEGGNRRFDVGDWRPPEGKDIAAMDKCADPIHEIERIREAGWHASISGMDSLCDFARAVWEQHQSDDTTERQDAMLERRDTLLTFESLVQDGIAIGLGQIDYTNPEVAADVNRKVEVIRQALSLTSDEGTGCVVPEAVRWLLDRWHDEAVEVNGPTVDWDSGYRRAKNEDRDALKRAIAEQGK